MKNIKQLEKLMKRGIKFEKKFDFDRASNVYEKMLYLIEGIKPKSRKEMKEKYAILAAILMRKGGVANYKGKNKSAKRIVLKALKYAKKSESEITIARCILALGVVESYASNYKKAEKLLRKALAMFEKSKDFDHRQGACWSLLNLNRLCLRKLLSFER